MGIIAERENFLQPLQKFVRTKPTWVLMSHYSNLVMIHQTTDFLGNMRRHDTIS
jgi:hypothetical protein